MMEGSTNVARGGSRSRRGEIEPPAGIVDEEPHLLQRIVAEDEAGRSARPERGEEGKIGGPSGVRQSILATESREARFSVAVPPTPSSSATPARLRRCRRARPAPGCGMVTFALVSITGWPDAVDLRRDDDGPVALPRHRCLVPVRARLGPSPLGGRQSPAWLVDLHREAR